MFRIPTPILSILTVVALVTGTACSQAPPAKRYPIKGQVLAVLPDKQSIVVHHGDIPGFMPAMTMTYPVASVDDLNARKPGELITATLEVSNTEGRLLDIVHTGSAPLPKGANQAALAMDMLSEGDAVPDAAFVDQQNRRRAFAEWHDTLTVVTFMYTSCPLPNFCPLMDQNFATLQKRVGQDPTLAGKVQLVSITIDPAHDTPAVLAKHAREHDADPAVWTYLTGDEATIDRFAGRFGVGVMRADDGSITHNLRTAVIGQDGRIRKFYSGNDWTPGQVLTELRTAAATS